jgi:hypothetical protein
MPVQRSEVTTVNEMIRGDLGHFHFFDARTSHGRGVFSGFLVGTNRMLALATASQNRFCVRLFILLPFDVGLNVSRWHQSHGMAKRLQLSWPHG